MLTVTHAKVSAKPAGVDPAKVRPGDWNASHTISGAVDASEVTGLDAAVRARLPWFDVTDPNYGAVGDGVTDDTQAFQDALDDAAASGIGGGLVLVPNARRYYIPGGLSMSDHVWMESLQRDSAILFCGDNDVTPVILHNDCRIKNLTIEGKGLNQSVNTGASFGASSPAVLVDGGGSFIEYCKIHGGSNTILLSDNSEDCRLSHVLADVPYFDTMVFGSASSIHNNCSYDMNQQGNPTDFTPPYATWLPTTVYTAGKVRTHPTEPFLMLCTVGGQSGSSAPQLANYGFNIPDGGATWVLYAPVDLSCAAFVDGGVIINACDFSSSCYRWSITFDSGGVPRRDPYITIGPGSTMSRPVQVRDGSGFDMMFCSASGAVVLSDYPGVFNYIGNRHHASDTDVTIGANVNNFHINGNYMSGAAITVANGTSDKYFITQNIDTSVTDNGTGLNKSVANNF